MALRRLITDADREEVSRGIAEGALGPGDRRAAAGARSRPKVRKLEADPQLRGRVVAKLRAGASPDRVAGRLRYERTGAEADRVADTVSHEAIYTWIYALPKGELDRQGSCCARAAPAPPRWPPDQSGCADRRRDRHARPTDQDPHLGPGQRDSRRHHPGAPADLALLDRPSPTRSTTPTPTASRRPSSTATSPTSATCERRQPAVRFHPASGSPTLSGPTPHKEP